MRATRDWSYGLLSNSEQTVLRTSRFSRKTLRTSDQQGGCRCGPPRKRDHRFFGRGGAKSLVVADVGRADPRLRLLETTRAYVFTKLAESGESDLIAQRFAEYSDFREASAQRDGAADD